MRKTIMLVAALAAVLGFVPYAFAAGWSLTLDTPVSYAFKSTSATIPTPNSAPAPWRNQTTTDVSGSKVLLIAPFHVGIGYEDYSVAGQFDFFGQNNAPSIGKAVTQFRIYDIVVDVPMKYLNVTLGYGQGTADTDVFQVSGPGTGGQNPGPIRGAKVSQVFLTLGIPLGERLDVHLGYHRVTVESQDITKPGSNGPFDQTDLSGDMLSAGLRFNF
jgi:hypothetical protein